MKTKKYIQGLSQGKTKRQSAMDAGYSLSTAENAKQKIEGTKSFECFRSELQMYLLDQGLGPQMIVQGLLQLFHKKHSTFYKGKEVKEKSYYILN